MSMNRNESKYFNTAARMDEALLALLEKKEFEFITVREICEAAGVNRSTFYLHYENTRELLDESVGALQKKFWECFGREHSDIGSRIVTAGTDELLFITPEYLAPYLEFVKQNRRVYAVAMRMPDAFDTHGTLNMLRSIIDPILSRFGVPSDRREYMMAYYLNGISAVVGEWLKNDCRDPVDMMISVIEQCVLAGYYGGKKTGGKNSV